MNILDLVRAKKRRLYILKLLSDSTSYCADSFVLQELLGHLHNDVSHSELINDLIFLEKSNLITNIKIDDGLSATVTQNGVDVACGLLTADGVSRPSPESIKAAGSFKQQFWGQLKCMTHWL